jgi:hypothetical protein
VRYGFFRRNTHPPKQGLDSAGLVLLSFPIYRQIPFWPHLSLADIFALWFLFITPITTVIAIVMLIKRGHSERIAVLIRMLAWLVITFSVIANILILVGMWASTY